MPQDMPLWPKDYFDLEATGKQTEEKLPALPVCQKAGHKFTKVYLFSLSRVKVSPGTTLDPINLDSPRDICLTNRTSQPLSLPMEL